MGGGPGTAFCGAVTVALAQAPYFAARARLRWG
jgi:hypothetical protein